MKKNQMPQRPPRPTLRTIRIHRQGYAGAHAGQSAPCIYEGQNDGAGGGERHPEPQVPLPPI